MATNPYTASERISRPKNSTMRLLAEAMVMPPAADSIKST